MPSSRDSSVLRSLAVAFGDGLAFGAGLKLTQRAAGAPGSASAHPGDLAPLMERIAEIEKRVEESARAPVRAPSRRAPRRSIKRCWKRWWPRSMRA